MEGQFYISVVVPVFNTEKYVEQTIKSVINQSIGFEKNIELLLVDNASTDHSGQICEGYAKRYPRNIRYFSLAENHGPCDARNKGLLEASGKFVNYLDSDDLWEYDALEKLAAFMEANEGDCDLVVGRVRHFDGKEAWHELDWKFRVGEDGRVVNIFEKPSFVQLHLGSVLIKADVAKQYSHDSGIYHAEDAKYISQILLDCKCYGMCGEAVYLYRNRREGDSVLQNTSRSLRWYYDTPKRVYWPLIHESKKKFGRIIEYIQYLIMYELQWRLSEKNVSDEVKKNSYVKSIQELVKCIDDEIIMAQKSLLYERKLYALQLKYGMRLDMEHSYFPPENALFLKSVLVWDNKIHVCGFVRFPYIYEYDNLLLQINGQEEREVSFDAYNQFEDVFSMGEDIAHADTFFCIVPYDSDVELRFVLVRDGQRRYENLQISHNTNISGGGLKIESDRICAKFLL